jgi:glucan phosphoethanolaminetransferase (alkaline phosphatase superfamily)
MAIGITFVVAAVLILAVWMLAEFKKFRHKIWAIFLIVLILAGYFSFNSAIKGKDLDFKTLDGLKEAGGLYFSWLGHAFGNMKTITSNAVNMNWTNVPKVNTSNSTG